MIELTVTDHVAHVELNRPDKHNAINGEMMSRLILTAAAIEADPTIRSVVLSGRGRSFCAGLDTSNFASMMSGDLSGSSPNVQAALRRHLSPGGANRAQQVGWCWQELSVPVVAAIHGSALGGGLNLATRGRH